MVFNMNYVDFPFKAPVRIGVIFKHLRQLLDLLLERKLANPKLSLEGTSHLHCWCQW